MSTSVCKRAREHEQAHVFARMFARVFARAFVRVFVRVRVGVLELQSDMARRVICGPLLFGANNICLVLFRRVLA